ncbi:hypothetical protein Hanom_Chr07g00675621 [Helianthus anomalus]
MGVWCNRLWVTKLSESKAVVDGGKRRWLTMATAMTIEEGYSTRLLLVSHFHVLLFTIHNEEHMSRPF